MTKKTVHTSFWTLLLLYFVSFHGIGQQRSSYSGTYKVGGYEGRAAYTYQVIGIDTVLDGPFTMERSNLEDLLQKNDSSFLFSGNFEDGHPHGDWLFQFGEFYTDSTTQVSGFQYQVNVNGTLKEAKGTLKQGKPNGTWKISQKKIKDSQVLDTLFFSEVTFLEGIPQQSFNIGTPHTTLIGRFLRSGLAHDTWSLYSDEADAIESWLFREGWLEKIEWEADGNPLSVTIFEQPFSRSKIIDLDEGFSTLLHIYAALSSQPQLELSKGINKLLLQNSTSYNTIETILSELGSTEFLTGFKVRAPYFPLDSLSLKQMDSTAKLVNRSTEISTSFLNNTRLNLIRRSDEEVNYMYHVVKSLDSTFLRPLKRLVELKELDVIENISEEMMAAYVFPNGKPSTQIVITTNTGIAKPFSGPGAETLHFDKEGIEGYLDMATYVLSSLDEIAASLGEKLADDKQQQEFVLLENQLITQINGLNQFPDSVRQRMDKPALRALDSIKSKAEQLLSEYAEMETNGEKLNQARMLINCMVHFQNLSQEIAMLPKNSEELGKKYTDAVWNPFTATIMDETVKKRITSSYKNVLLPYFLDKVESGLSCANGEELQVLFKDTYQRMLELRDEDTSKLERKLRKERNPKVILQLFNLKPLVE